MSNTENIPERSEIPDKDKWNLSKLFPDDPAWEEGLQQFHAMLPKIESFQGTLGESAEKLRGCLDFMTELGILEERLGYYAQLRLSENGGDSSHQAKFAKFMQAAAKAEALASYQQPEILAIPDEKMRAFLGLPELEEYGIMLRKLLRFKAHTLSRKEEKILALQTETNQTASKTFSALTDVDLEFGTITTKEGERPLSQSSFSRFMIHQDRKIREKAYRQFYAAFEKHKNTLASLYAGSVNLDIYTAKVRNYPSARAAALFPDKVPESVYDNLIEEVHNGFDTLHRYYALRKRVLGVDTLKHYDVYVPLVKDLEVDYPYDKGVDTVIQALAPLGEEYQSRLKEGLTGGWVDKYENKGKRSGAFSAGSFIGDPYILLNYKSDVLRNVFTLAHEGGHSMHSYYSTTNNPFQHYNYTIFEAEVASTFNEQLLGDYLKRHAETEQLKAYLIGKEVDDIIATVVRQTMFAEFEKITHEMVERGEPLTVDSLRNTYRTLLENYFGPDMELEDLSDLEGLRIPHFYRAFYVYKYATGLSAAIAVSKQVMDGGENERRRYLQFLSSGGSKFPIDSLKEAGVDMTSPGPVREALQKLKILVERLEKLV